MERLLSPIAGQRQRLTGKQVKAVWSGVSKPHPHHDDDDDDKGRKAMLYFDLKKLNMMLMMTGR